MSNTKTEDLGFSFSVIHALQKNEKLKKRKEKKKRKEIRGTKIEAV